MQNWILNRETGKFELYEDYEEDKKKTVQKALFDFHMERIKEAV